MQSIRCILVLLASVLLVFAPGAHPQGAINSRLIERQLWCVLDKAPCDYLGNQIKRALPEIIGNDCSSCDSRQQANVRRISRYVKSKYPDAWEELMERYAKK